MRNLADVCWTLSLRGLGRAIVVESTPIARSAADHDDDYGAVMSHDQSVRLEDSHKFPV